MGLGGWSGRLAARMNPAVRALPTLDDPPDDSPHEPGIQSSPTLDEPLDRPALRPPRSALGAREVEQVVRPPSRPHQLGDQRALVARPAHVALQRPARAPAP